MLLQFVVAFYLLAFGAGYLILIVKWHGIADPVPFLPLYFGLLVDQPEALIQTVLALFPPLVFWGLLGAALYSLGLLVLLYLRVPYGNLLYLINAVLTFTAGLLGILFFFDSWAILLASIIGLLVGLGQFVITLNLWHDFTFKATRLRLKIDSGVKNHLTFYLSGRNYSQSGMWGLAIIHLRRAVVRAPSNVTYRVALAKAYLNINRSDLAQKEFQEAQTLQPNVAEVVQLGARLGELKRS
jgi:type II secretory pathway component PulF